MAFDRTALLEKVSLRLALHGYSSVDIAVLAEIAKRENQDLRIKLQPEIDSGRLLPESRTWLETYCYAGPSRIAMERGLSESAVRRSLATLKTEGLIEVVDRVYRQYRRLNVPAFQALGWAGSAGVLYLAHRKKKLTASPLGPLNWEKYLNEGVVTNSVLDDILGKINGSPYKRYFGSTWERTNYLLTIRALKNGDLLQIEAGIDKPGDADRLDSAMPYLLTTHPAVAALTRVEEGFVYRSRSNERLEADDVADADEEEIDDAA
jgi:hypothetical protein